MKLAPISHVLSALLLLMAFMPATAQTRLPATEPLFAEPLRIQAFVSTRKGLDDNAAAQVSSPQRAVQETVIGGEGLGMPVRVTVKTWNWLFPIERQEMVNGKTRRHLTAKSVTLQSNDWLPLRKGSSIQAEIDWGEGPPEIRSCTADKMEKAELTLKSLTGNAWRIQCDVITRSRGEMERETHGYTYLVDSGFAFVSRVDTLNYQLVSVDIAPR